MTTIGFIGSGKVGGSLARLAADAGHDVVLSNSRGPHTLAGMVAEIGDRARAATLDEAVRAADVVVLAVPLGALGEVPVELTGKTVVDTCNYYPLRDGRIPALDTEETTTSELVAATFAGAYVVKAFSSIPAALLRELARDPGADDRSALPFAADDAPAEAAVAKAEGMALVDQLGFDPYDVGPLAEGWRFQRDTPAYVTPYRQGPVSTEQLRGLLDSARRYRDISS
jgi:predicted dinucleotide-binding enzyme